MQGQSVKGSRFQGLLSSGVLRS